MKERRPKSADTDHHSQFGFALSPETNEMLRGLSNQGQPTPHLDRRQAQEIRNLKGFLNTADAGVQGIDFRNPEAPINDDRRLARSIALQVLCQDLFPSDRSLPYSDAVKAHQRMMALRNALDNLDRGFIPIPEMILLSQSVGAIEQMQAKIPLKP